MNKHAYNKWLRVHFTYIALSTVACDLVTRKRQWFTVRDLRKAIANRETNPLLRALVELAQHDYSQHVCKRGDRSINWMFYEFSDRIQRALNALVRQGVLMREIDKQYTRQDGWSDPRAITVTRYRYRFA